MSSFHGKRIVVANLEYAYISVVYSVQLYVTPGYQMIIYVNNNMMNYIFYQLESFLSMPSLRKYISS